VLFQDGNLDTRAGQQQGEDHPGRPAAHHATCCPLRHRLAILPGRGRSIRCREWVPSFGPAQFAAGSDFG